MQRAESVQHELASPDAPTLELRSAPCIAERGGAGGLLRGPAVLLSRSYPPKPMAAARGTEVGNDIFPVFVVRQGDRDQPTSFAGTGFVVTRSSIRASAEHPSFDVADGVSRGQWRFSAETQRRHHPEETGDGVERILSTLAWPEPILDLLLQLLVRPDVMLSAPLQEPGRLRASACLTRLARSR